MTTNKKLASVALAGLFTAGMMVASPAFAGENEKGACKSASGCKGHSAMEKASCKTSESKEKHACKGLNSCKGNGGDGKNECKGHGSCATDGSK
jgi:nitrogen fixation protein FixH